MIYTLIVLAFLGFIDATYLTIEHFMGGIIPCTTGGCEAVTNSVYATIGPVPISLIGAFYYLSVFVLLILVHQEKKELYYKIFLLIEAGAFLTSLFLVYLQLFVIGQICDYCMVSAGITTSLFVLGLLFWRKIFPLKPIEQEVASV